MKRHAIPLTMTGLILAIILLPAPAFSQGIPGVTGVGTALFPLGTIFNGLPLTGLQFGLGAFIPGDSSATGQFQLTLLGISLLGISLNIELDGQVTNGMLNPDGSRTVSGTATLDMGDGSLPLVNVPFGATANAAAIVLSIENINLPAVPLSAGSIIIQ